LHRKEFLVTLAGWQELIKGPFVEAEVEILQQDKNKELKLSSPSAKPEPDLLRKIWLAFSH
jgi:hypothetical protein